LNKNSTNPTGPGEIKFGHALLPVLFLVALIVYGLILRPHAYGLPPIPLEVLFILASVFAVSELFWLGFTWPEIQNSIVARLSRALPAFFILFAIGILISSWIVSGTIPMLVYYGIGIISPSYLYVLAFLVPVVFSSLTGTSWGSAGTIGVVIIGIAGAFDAHLGITAGAIIGGAYFGDKMSPLSDTTNLAALATDVDLFDHIRSMTVTTVPSAILAATGFFILGFVYPPGIDTADLSSISPGASSPGRADRVVSQDADDSRAAHGSRGGLRAGSGNSGLYAHRRISIPEPRIRRRYGDLDDGHFRAHRATGQPRWNLFHERGYFHRVPGILFHRGHRHDRCHAHGCEPDFPIRQDADHDHPCRPGSIGVHQLDDVEPVRNQLHYRRCIQEPL
jgi:hypothetical protein